MEHPRTQYQERVLDLLGQFPVVALLGPRQVGKTTLAKRFQVDKFFDLENPLHRSRLENPLLEIESTQGLVVLDEIQNKRDLFPVLRYLVDQKTNLKFLILGSSSPDLLKRSSKTLAGRIAFVKSYGFLCIRQRDFCKTHFRLARDIQLGRDNDRNSTFLTLFYLFLVSSKYSFFCNLG